MRALPLIGLIIDAIQAIAIAVINRRRNNKRKDDRTVVVTDVVYVDRETGEKVDEENTD